MQLGGSWVVTNVCYQDSNITIIQIKVRTFDENIKSTIAESEANLNKSKFLAIESFG